MNSRQRARIIADVKVATGRSIPPEAVQRVLEGDFHESHPVDAAIVAAIGRVRKKKK